MTLCSQSWDRNQLLISNKIIWLLVALIVAFTLAGISGIQISVFASRLKSWDFYKCGHKNLTNYRDQHRAANRNTYCDYLGISAIICIAADVWTLEQIILVFSIPSFQASVSKQGQCLIAGTRSSVTRIIPLGDQRDISTCLNKRKNISVFQSRWKSRSFLCMNAPSITNQN